MHEVVFDAVSRRFGVKESRREALVLALAAVFAGTAEHLGAETSIAKKRRRKPRNFCDPPNGFPCKANQYCSRHRCINGCRPGTDCGGSECKAVRAHCDQSSECCDGICFDNFCDGRVCCKPEGWFCQDNCQCCGDLSCFNGQCQ